MTAIVIEMDVRCRGGSGWWQYKKNCSKINYLGVVCLLLCSLVQGVEGLMFLGDSTSQISHHVGKSLAEEVLGKNERPLIEGLKQWEEFDKRGL